MAGSGSTKGGGRHKALPLACRLSRWITAAVMAAGWLGLYGYWLASGTDPDCQVTTVIQGARAGGTTITRACGLPGTAAYLYVGVLIVLLLLPDAKAIAFGGFRYEPRDDISPVSQLVGEAVGGDEPGTSSDAADVLRRYLLTDDDS